MMAKFPLILDTWAFIVPGVIMGIGMACIWSQLSVATFETISTGKSSEAAGLFNVMRVMGGSVGIAICSTLLVRREQVHWNHLGQHVYITNPDVSRWLDASGIDMTEPNTGGRFQRRFRFHILNFFIYDSLTFVNVTAEKITVSN